jgi:hypothetical protein
VARERCLFAANDTIYGETSMQNLVPPSLKDTALAARIDWLRSLTPGDAVEAIVAALEVGVPEPELWAAGSLTAARFVNNQAHNLLGFVSHAMIGCQDARALSAGQPDPIRKLLIVQALYQVARDLRDPSFAPYELLPYWPIREHSPEASVTQLRRDIRIGEYMRADHRFVGLSQELPRAALVDLLLDIGLEGMCSDDHTLITPVLCLGMIDLVGWERGFDLLRWSVRYSASFARNFAPYDRAAALLESYSLVGGPQASGLQPERVADLRLALLAGAPADRPDIAARALREQVSPETILAAAALVCCDMYLMTTPTPHADFDAVSREVAPIHLGTTLEALRAALPRLAPRTRALAAIQIGSLLERGPCVLNESFEFVPFTEARPYPYQEDVVTLRGMAPGGLLEHLREALFSHDYRTATAAVAAYAAVDADPEALIGLLTAVACTDDGTLLHNFKHLHAMVDGFRGCALPDRWLFLICAARWVAWYAGLSSAAYERAQPLLSGLSPSLASR